MDQHGSGCFYALAAAVGRRPVLLVELDYSQLLWLRFHSRQGLLTLFSEFEEALALFADVRRELLFGQMRVMIVGDH